MASRQTYFTSEESRCNATDNASYPSRTNIDSVRIDNRPFESPRGRGRNNSGWGRVDGIPFVSPRGRGRRIPIQARLQDPNTAEDGSYEAEQEHLVQESHGLRKVQQLTAPDGTLYYSGLIRLDGREFESPRGRGRNNPGWGRVDGRPFVSQRGHIAHQRRSAQSYAASAPTYEDVLDAYDY